MLSGMFNVQCLFCTFFKQTWGKKKKNKPETFMTVMKMLLPVALIKQGNFLSGFFNNPLILNPFL